jgi:arylsulfatase A-like enzyme
MLEANAGKAKGTYAPLLIHERMLQFIEDHKDRPFFCYVPTIIPHAELAAPEEYMEKFRGRFEEPKPYKGYDEGERFRKGPYQSQAEPRTAFAAMVTLLDDQVGEIVAKVEELGIADRTLIIFTSDNGPHREGGADPDFFNSNGLYRGYKRDLYEGGIHVPMIACWPGRIQSGTTAEQVSAFWDMVPTFTELAGVEPPQNIDGISLVPTLLGQGKQPAHKYLYWEFHERGGRVAVRMGKWKGVRYDVLKQPGGPLELYDLSKDPGEKSNIAAAHPETAARIEAIMKSARTESDIFRFRK